MKPRKWVFVLFCIILSLFVLLVQGVKHLEKEKNIEKLLVEHLSPVIGGEFDVEKVKLGFLSASLSNVKVQVPVHTISVHIRRITVSFSFHKLLSSGFDFAQCINKVAVSGPRIQVAVAQPLSADSSAPARRTSIRDAIAALPVNEIRISKGELAIRDKNRRVHVLGKRLSGVLQAGPQFMKFSLKGKVGSFRKNFSFTGHLNAGGRGHRFSVRLADAKVHEEINFGSFVLEKCSFDLVNEFICDDEISVENSEMRGEAHVDQATVRVPGRIGAIDNVSCRLVFRDEEILADSLAGSWGDIGLVAHGVWGLRPSARRDIKIMAREVALDPFLSGAPRFVANLLLGKMAIALRIRQLPASGVAVDLAVGGLSFAGIPLTEANARGALQGDTLTIDTLLIHGHSIDVRGRGKLGFAYDKAAYSFSGRLSADTLPALPKLAGTLGATCNISGRGNDYTYKGRVHAGNLAWEGFSFGDPHISFEGSREHMSMRTLGRGGGHIRFDGRIDSLMSQHPLLHANVEPGADVMLEVIDALPQVWKQHLDTLWARGEIHGRLPLWQAHGTFGLSSDIGRGSFFCTLQQRDTSDSCVEWTIRQQELFISATRMPFAAAGKMYRDSLLLDSLRAFNGLLAQGHLGTGHKNQYAFNLQLHKMPVRTVKALIQKHELPIENGFISGKSRITGNKNFTKTNSELRLEHANLIGIQPVSADAIILTRDSLVTVLPMVIRQNNKAIITLDTVSNARGIQFSGAFDDVDMGSCLGRILGDDIDLRGKISGSFGTVNDSLPIRIEAASARISVNSWSLDSIKLTGQADARGLDIVRLSARDSTLTSFNGHAYLPYSAIQNKERPGDTVKAALSAHGDLLASLHKNLDSPMGGSARGTMDFSLLGTEGKIVSMSGFVDIPHGILEIQYFVPSKVDDFKFSLHTAEDAKIHVDMNGMIRNKPIRIYSTHTIPPGYEPLVAGPLNFGIMLVETNDGPVELHIPGFHDIGEVAEVIFEAREPFGDFALSGPIDKVKITGAWVLRNTEFTFPLLQKEQLPWDFDPFPYVRWEMDVKAGRKVTYFWDLQGKRRRLIRFAELLCDQSTEIRVRGRMVDNTFRLYGAARSYKGEIFYGRVFDRNVQVGLDFAPQSLGEGKGYENNPIIWGSAETFSDTSRFERITLTLQLQDPVSGSIASKGRVAMVPATGMGTQRERGEQRDSIPNFIFHVSSPFEEIPGESERAFYANAGLRFSTFEGAGGFFSDFGEQYVHQYLLRKPMRKLARKMGLDVMTFETSIASNYFYYFYNRQYDALSNRWNLLANMGVTVGRYVLKDLVFLKARGEFVPSDTLLRPEYSIGLEFMPVHNFIMDFNNSFYQYQDELQYNPQVRMQLRLPIQRIRNLLDF
ncbi:MAG: hypothetical protein GF398_12420 [Chitinivibrionales bacterium]|nr:hypothetical protein [Chitinivibrionales bacterium]